MSTSICRAARRVLSLIALLVSVAPATAQNQPAAWQKTIEIAPGPATGDVTEQAFQTYLKQQGAAPGAFVNWYTGRFPSISFLGGQCNGNVSDDLEFFFEKPFRYYNQAADFVMERGGAVYGIRAHVRRIKENSRPGPARSFLLSLRCDQLLRDYHPSYILVNGRRVWDSKQHPMQQQRIMVPFSLEAPVDPVLDFVVDQAYTPEVKGLAFRMFFVNYLGEVGTKVDLQGAAPAADPQGSPADKLQRFAFGLFPADWDFWGNRGIPFAQIKQTWKPNFRPAYPVDDLWLCPVVFDGAAKGKYHDFMVTYGGCNVLGARPDVAVAKANPYVRGALASQKDLAGTKALLAAGLEAHWFGGEYGVLAPASEPAHLASMAKQRQTIEDARQATGQPEKVRTIFEPFSPALSCAHEYERGQDLVVLKNEEDPQYNLMMALARGAGRTFGKPFGFYWEQTHYPEPSQDFKLQACLLYYLSGGSWIGAEAENFPAFESNIVAERALPYVQALRFAMVHPARGQPVVPIGIVWGLGDKWIVPYNPLGHLDTFLRCFDYDHATKTLTAEPNFLAPHAWTPANRAQWNFNTTGHMSWLYDSVPELRGYDLLDVFYPQYGDAFTAHIARLLTGTPYGPVDFVYANQATAQHLQSFGMLAILGHAALRPELEQKLTAAVVAGTPLVLGAQHLRLGPGDFAKAFGVELSSKELAPVDGPVTGAAAIYPTPPGKFTGKVYGYQGAGWEPVASVAGKTLVIRKAVGKGEVYLYLGEWIGEGGAALRPVLAKLAAAAAPLRLAPADDQVEYVAYRKGAGAWVALFNHGAIAVGCDRLKELRATPPEPLVSQIKGPYQGELTFRLDRLGLDPQGSYAVYEVEGIDGPAFAEVIAGTRGLAVKEIPSQQQGGVLRATVKLGTRGQFVVAPKGQGEQVFFGKP